MLRIFFVIFVSILLHAGSWAKDSTPAPGAIDSIRYDSKSNHVYISGWMKEADITSHETQFEIFAHEEAGEIQEKIINGAHFDLDVKFQRPLPGGLVEIQTTITPPSGEKNRLRLTDGSPPLLHIPKIYERHWILLGITLLSIALSYTKRCQQFGHRLANWVQNHTRGIAGGILIFGLMLIFTGITGSSLRIVLEGPVAQAISSVNGNSWQIFKPQYSRGDEWGILTPNALAQVHHTPPFPIVNTNLGIDGQNMGVLGMTGVPITQWAAIARPATWGYFFLPLRQAQSWQWQLPFWGCLLALWWLLNILKPHSSGRNLTLSVLFCIAPYAAAWSNWPLYFTFFPVIAFACFIKIIKSRNIKYALLWGAGMGYALAAWVLTLYPPWMVSIGTLCALLCAGWLLDQRSSLQINLGKIGGVIIGLIVASTLLGSWWLDTKDAIELMQNTVYPGQRTKLTGGDGGMLWTFRGFTNAESVTFSGVTPWTNQPEISSYIWLPFAMGWLCIYGLMREKKNRWLLFGCTIFIAYYFIFIFIGIPEWAAKATQWGRVPTSRADISLGLAFIALLCLTDRTWLNAPPQDSPMWVRKALMAIATAGSAWLSYTVLSTMPIFVFPKNSSAYIASFIIFTTFCVWWLIKGKTTAPIALLLIFSLTASIGFNPITKAPRSIEINPETKALASDKNGNLQRTLFVSGEGMGPHFLPAVGLPTTNGVLAYPQSTLWKQLQLPEKDWPTVNRYQHLAFTTGTPSNDGSYSVSSPWMEWVVVTINPEKFNFSLTGAQRVAAFEEQATNLRKSPMLKEIGSHKGLVWFAVNSSS